MIFSNSYDNTFQAQTDSSSEERKEHFMIQVKTETGERLFFYPVIFTAFAFRKDERIQIINGFNEVIHLYAFGKNPDQLQLVGYILATDAENPSHKLTGTLFTNFYNSVMRAFSGANSGIRTRISGPHLSGNGGVILSGIANSMQISMNGQMNGYMDFTLNFIGIDSVMGVGNIPEPQIVREGSLTPV
jgi:hypothetical protein